MEVTFRHKPWQSEFNLKLTLGSVSRHSAPGRSATVVDRPQAVIEIVCEMLINSTSHSGNNHALAKLTCWMLYEGASDVINDSDCAACIDLKVSSITLIGSQIQAVLWTANVK